ncbi:MAG TPA: protealysin inhibitor emfourin [Actinoplanes sp.]|nr:protealysin inhibitor emfourin [Actinoplanes sp.]
MRVTLAVHGGLAAAINLRRPPRVVDTEALPADQAQELSRLVDAATRAHSHQPAGAVPTGDAMSYTITVERAGASSVLTGSDNAASPEFTDLLAWLEANAR